MVVLVLLKSIDLLKSYKFENKGQIQNYIWLSLFHQSKKMFRQKNFYLFIRVIYYLIIKITWLSRIKLTIE
jgi:hypothetical protein